MHKVKDGIMYDTHKTVSLIREIAKKKSLSITEMLSECDLSKNALSTMDRRGSWLASDSLAKIADYLGVSVDDLLDRKSPDADSHIRTSDEVLREQLQRLSDESLVMLRDYTRYLLWLQAHPAETAASEGSESLQ